VGAATMIDGKTGYILLRRFSATTIDEVNKAIDKLDKQNFNKLIFDLRGNSGGYLEQAAAVSNLFISTKDTLVYTKGKISDSNQAFISKPEKGRNDFSLIVLINRGSASASEIVSGAVQDLDRGLIVGETSFGKGLVQRQLPLEGGSAIRITMARYYTPSGRLIQRPYEEGDDLTYYKELYAKDRESTLDSLKQLRPKYKTRQGRTVYGGGGITPDIYIPYKSKLTKETQKILRNPERPIFNFSSTYATQNELDFNNFNNFNNFKKDWQVSQSVYSQFLDYLDSDSIVFNSDSLLKDKTFIYNRIKSEIAGTAWGKDEATSIRLSLDNQVSEALKYFNEADAFLGYRN
jgi:carboxyl-terminal processing protease